ncbi:hypothetical protein [Croceicoccus gelatinilyticus]|uniref:hypothetical protein n=1 Tax=Croceicoccus gelatinilyticus TaxID=2835536 RepID=UPI001BCF4DC0|nr:hypothetical protein [Croceicoccus gelatinilyticus]MBS7671423.1 hypothetical protein [Croceicoccus gelatinilyticus]
MIPEADKQDEQIVAQSENAGLAVSREDFVTRFNALAEAAGKNWTFEPINPDNPSFMYSPTDNLAFTGSLDESDDIANLIIIATGDGSLESGTDALMAMAIVYCAANDIPDLKQCGQPISKLVSDFSDGGPASKVKVDGLEFSYIRNEMMGNVLTVDPAID